MKTFQDKTGRSWTIEVNYGVIRRIKRVMAEQKIDLLEPSLPRGIDPKSAEVRKLKPGETSLFSELNTDLVLFCDVLAALLDPQIVNTETDVVLSDGNVIKHKLTIDDFYEAMAGDELYQAQVAFMEEWADFFRKRHQIEQVALMEKQTAYRAKALAAVMVRLNSPEMTAMLDSRLDGALNDGFSSLQESLVSIPAPARSAS